MSAIGHHWATIRRALDEERQRSTGRLTSQEPDFLPAALAVVEKPVSPTGRLAVWVLLAGVAVSLGWSVFGKVDIVATARGRIIPTDNVKLVQAANAGIVRRIYVHEGDTVRRGQPLVDLDPTVSTADESQAGKALLAAELDVARNRAIADGLSGKPINFVAPAGTPDDVLATQRQLIASQISEVAAQSAGFAAARASALSDAEAARVQAKAYADTVPVLDKELEAMNGLAAQGYAPGLKLMELQRQRRSEAGSRDIAVVQQQRGLADARKYGEQAAQSRAQALQTVLADLAKAQSDVLLRRDELTKARQKSHIQRLVAPADGTVQQLGVHTVGGVVEAVRPLMVLVPSGGVTVEARILNKDAGFVRVGQPVAVKLDAFPFTRYGSIKGRIVSISHDAVQDNRMGAYYVARISLGSRFIQTESGAQQLGSGLETTNDIKIGSRRIIDYLLSPIESGLGEAGHEH